jgi:hypothetical protein
MIDTLKAMEMYCRIYVTMVAERVFVEKLPESPALDPKFGRPFPAMTILQTGGNELIAAPLVEPLYTLTCYGRNLAECMSIYSQFWRSTRTVTGISLPPRRINNRWMLLGIVIASQPTPGTEPETDWPVVQFAVSARWDALQGA